MNLTVRDLLRWAWHWIVYPVLVWMPYQVVVVGLTGWAFWDWQFWLLTASVIFAASMMGAWKHV